MNRLLSDKSVNIVMYANYPNGIPKCEKLCIDRAQELADNFYGIGINLDPKPLEEYIQRKLGVLPSYLKPIHYSDYLTYHSVACLRDVYGIKLNDNDVVLVIDADFYITSKFILRDMTKMIMPDCGTLLGSDNGYMVHYGSKVPSTFWNVHWSLQKWSHDESKELPNDKFLEALDDYWNNNHYTATGPALVGKLRNTNNCGFYCNESVAPFTFDPSIITYAGTYKIPLKSGALGLHTQSSIVGDLGFEISDIRLESNYIILELKDEL